MVILNTQESNCRKSFRNKLSQDHEHLQRKKTWTKMERRKTVETEEQFQCYGCDICTQDQKQKCLTEWTNNINATFACSFYRTPWVGVSRKGSELPWVKPWFYLEMSNFLLTQVDVTIESPRSNQITFCHMPRTQQV
jgi:hypothetical protein